MVVSVSFDKQHCPIPAHWTHMMWCENSSIFISIHLCSFGFSSVLFYSLSDTSTDLERCSSSVLTKWQTVSLFFLFVSASASLSVCVSLRFSHSAPVAAVSPAQPGRHPGRTAGRGHQGLPASGAGPGRGVPVHRPGGRRGGRARLPPGLIGRKPPKPPSPLPQPLLLHLLPRQRHQQPAAQQQHRQRRPRPRAGSSSSNSIRKYRDRKWPGGHRKFGECRSCRLVLR